MSGLELRRIGKSFGSVRVVQDIDLKVEQGEFVVLLGESGCGKSTTLRMIAGLETPSEGSIFIGGRDVTSAAPMRRDIAMVFQNYALYPHMDVAQNMSFSLRLAGLPKSEIDKRVQDAARILNITALLPRKPRELSGGQRQRVAIGRCIVREPKVFLFDEPLSNLDAKLRGHMRAELAILHERLGKTTVYVTHDQVEAMTLASRIVIFDKGRIQQVGTPSEVFDRPANLFVAGFIGSPTMNLIPCRANGSDTGMMLTAEGIALPVTARKNLKAGQSCVAGIRPQDLRITDLPGQLALQVDVVEYLGTETVLVGTLAGQPDRRITVVVAGDRHDLLHKRVPLQAEPSRIHVFDAKTELNVSL